MTVKITKPALNLREELASLRNQGGLPKEDKLYLDNLVTNGDFSNGATGWSETTAGYWSISGGVATLAYTGSYSALYQELNIAVGTLYKVSFEVSGVTGKMKAGFVTQNGMDAVLSNITTNGVHTFIASPTDPAKLGIGISRDSGGGATIDNISVQEVGENLVTNGTFDSDVSGWTAADGATVTHQSGRMRVDGNVGTANQTITTVVGKSYTVSADLFNGTSASSAIYVSTTPSTAQLLASFSSPANSVTFTATATTTYIIARVNAASNTYIEVDNIRVTEGNHPVIQSIPYGYDVKDVYIDGELAREGEGYDYEVKTDGINQWLKPTIEPTATTETAVIGVRK